MFGRYYDFGGIGRRTTPNGPEKLRRALRDAEAVVIGAGAGLSTAAGYYYSGERFQRYLWDFHEKYGISDMYSGGFYPFASGEERFAWWSRCIWLNRYETIPTGLYNELFELVKDKEYFVLTTNVDHCFQRAGFDKARLFYTQGDYGLWQCPEPCHERTYDNEDDVRAMAVSQGFVIGENNELVPPADENGNTDFSRIRMTVPAELLPRCPVCGRIMTTNLRVDDAFVEDEGWKAAANRFERFLRRSENRKVLYLELGVGGNTPVIIKYPFWRLTRENPQATYVCVNYGETLCPKEIENRAILIDGDIRALVQGLRKTEAAP